MCRTAHPQLRGLCRCALQQLAQVGGLTVQPNFGSLAPAGESWYNARMETVIRTVGDIPASDRSALERVVGHQLRESQQLVIQVVSLAVPPADATTGDSLPDWCDVYEGLSPERVDEIDAAVVRSPSSRDLP